MKTKTSLLAVLGKDRPGIIASVTGILFETRCNLEDISMTVLEGEFAMMVMVSYESAKRAAVDKQLETLCRKGQLAFFWKDLKGPRVRSEIAAGSSLYVISAIGRDRTGIVYHVSRELAEQKLNILDLNSRILGKDPKKAVYAMVLEVEVPKNTAIKNVEKRLARTAEKLGIDLTLKPVERLEL